MTAEAAAVRSMLETRENGANGRATLQDFQDAHVTKELEVPLLGGRTVLIRSLGSSDTEAVEAATFAGWQVQLDDPDAKSGPVSINVAEIMVGDRHANRLAVLGGMIDPAVPDLDAVGAMPPAVVEFIGAAIRALSGLQSGPKALAELVESGARAGD